MKTANIELVIKPYATVYLIFAAPELKSAADHLLRFAKKELNAKGVESIVTMNTAWPSKTKERMMQFKTESQARAALKVLKSFRFVG